MATLMEGPPLAARIRAEVADEVRELGELGLVTVQVGEDPASTIYLRRKHEAAQAAGITTDDPKLPEDVSEGELLARLVALNAAEAIAATLVQLPLPPPPDITRFIIATHLIIDV